MRKNGFTLVELLVALTILIILASVTFAAGRKVYASSSLAVSASNLRQLASGAMAYLGEHNQTFWPYVQTDRTTREKKWWFGSETQSSQAAPEGARTFDPQQGPLAGYIPAGMRPDPSFGMGGKPFKPKYRFGYIGIGYNTELGGGMREEYASRDQSVAERYKPVNLGTLEKPGETVIFTTSAQVNTFQRPASSRNPMLEEFYGIDRNEVSVHFRHHGKAMVVFATGNAGFLEMDESTRDSRAPEANVGRFAPAGSLKYLR